jgi:hypothetical protein
MASAALKTHCRGQRLTHGCPCAFCLRNRSEHTIEENILKKSDQKRQLDFLAIQVRLPIGGPRCLRQRLL